MSPNGMARPRPSIPLRIVHMIEYAASCYRAMIGAQLIACHNASMECYRRAMLPDIPFDTRHGNLNSANKLSRTYATLLEALNRHRGKGQQKVTVEHVHVRQAVVGMVETPGGGDRSKSEDSNPSRRCTLNSSRQSSTSSAIPSSFAQSPHSLISPIHSDVETVSGGGAVVFERIGLGADNSVDVIPEGSVVFVRSDWSKAWPDPKLATLKEFPSCRTPTSRGPGQCSRRVGQTLSL